MLSKPRFVFFCLQKIDTYQLFAYIYTVIVPSLQNGTCCRLRSSATS